MPQFGGRLDVVLFGTRPLLERLSLAARLSNAVRRAVFGTGSATVYAIPKKGANRMASIGPRFEQRPHQVLSAYGPGRLRRFQAPQCWSAMLNARTLYQIAKVNEKRLSGSELRTSCRRCSRYGPSAEKIRLSTSERLGFGRDLQIRQKHPGMFRGVR